MIYQSDLGIVLIGPPGVGKGTQAARLRVESDLAHVATGDLLREHRARGTDFGRDASAYMAQRQLVPDALVVAMVRRLIQQVQRFLLDGFPRTVEQARALTDLLNAEGRRLTAAVLLDAPDDTVVERIACRADGRDDDRPATARRRMRSSIDLQRQSSTTTSSSASSTGSTRRDLSTTSPQTRAACSARCDRT